MAAKLDMQTETRAASKSASALVVEDLACGYGTKRVVEGFSARIETGEVFCLLGPNGVGKTTLFKTILGLIPRLGGTVALDGRDTARMSSEELAHCIAYVPQNHVPPCVLGARRHHDGCRGSAWNVQLGDGSRSRFGRRDSCRVGRL